MKQTIITFAAIYAVVLGATSCGGSNSNPVGIGGGGGSTGIAGYKQIERLARPAVKEATENFTDHETTNRVSPESATTDATLQQSIVTFDTTVAKRTMTHATVLASILIPDELIADLSKTDPGGYLGFETTGGAKFGGRGLTDDVIDADLGAIFGNTLETLGAGGLTPATAGPPSFCLSTDNVSSAQGQATDGITPATFPYVGAPH